MTVNYPLLDGSSRWCPNFKFRTFIRLFNPFLERFYYVFLTAFYAPVFSRIENVCSIELLEILTALVIFPSLSLN